MSAYEAAVAGGEADAWLNLGLVLRELGDLAGAMSAYRAAAAAGDSNGALSLAFELREQGEMTLAEQAVREAAKAGNEEAVGVLACWRWCATLDPALEADLRAGADHFSAARADLASLLLTTDRVDEARQVLERGVDLGEVESMLPLGNLYADVLGDVAAAAYTSGIAAGDSHCHNNLGKLLSEQGDRAGAEAQYRLGAAAGDALAATHLRELLEDDDAPE